MRCCFTCLINVVELGSFMSEDEHKYQREPGGGEFERSAGMLKNTDDDDPKMI